MTQHIHIGLRDRVGAEGGIGVVRRIRMLMASDEVIDYEVSDMDAFTAQFPGGAWARARSANFDMANGADCA